MFEAFFAFQRRFLNPPKAKQNSCGVFFRLGGLRHFFFPKASSMLGFSFSCLNRVGERAGFERWCADGVGARERKGKEGKGKERKGKEGKGRERKERKGKEGKGRERKKRMGKEGKRKGKGRERNGKEGKAMSGKRSRWRSASLAARTAADGVGARVAGNGWGEEAAGDVSELGCADGCGWLRGRLWTGNGCGELRGRLRTAWVQGSGWKWAGRRTRCSPRTRMLTRMLMDIAVTENNFLPEFI